MCDRLELSSSDKSCMIATLWSMALTHTHMCLQQKVHDDNEFDEQRQQKYLMECSTDDDHLLLCEINIFSGKMQ